MSLFIPSMPLNVILSKMSDFALRADLKETTFGLLFTYMGKLFHKNRRTVRAERRSKEVTFMH